MKTDTYPGQVNYLWGLRGTIRGIEAEKTGDLHGRTKLDWLRILHNNRYQKVMEIYLQNTEGKKV